jgi:hypothetical protein
LNAKNNIKATGAVAIPVLKYSIGINNWRIDKIRNIDRKTCKVLTRHKMHNHKADIDYM